MSARFTLIPWLVVLIAAASCLAVQGCDTKAPPPTHADDICMRRIVFDECMAALPAGPVRTHYNDWSEVVEACDEHAEHVSWRRVQDIPAGCR